jgi:predicted nucleotide-binding protein
MTCQNETIKHSEMTEGPEAFTRFQDAMKKVLTVSPAELKRRIEAERAVSALNPNRRGPKPKKPSSSGHAADCR